MLVIQDPTRPNVILDSIVGLADTRTTQFRAMVAYTTLSGVETLVRALSATIGPRFESLPRAVITSFDYGITEPRALSHLSSIGFDVKIANLGEDSKVSLFPAGSAFHPKAYLLDTDDKVSAVVGSANLTRRALTVNSEAASVMDLAGDFQAVNSLWDAVAMATTPLTAELLDTYERLRPEALRTPRPSAEPIPPKELPSAGDMKVFADAVTAGEVDPQSFTSFWVEAGSMSSSGSHTQLELPRRACRFFGYQFESYDESHHVIGNPILMAGGQLFSDRRLTWHGNNRMERLNLPTESQAGLRYPGTAIMFHRDGDAFRVEVQPWESAAVTTWRADSAASGNQFRLGDKSPRMCGLI